MLVVFLLAGFGCSTTEQSALETRGSLQSTAESIDELLSRARSRSGLEAAALSIQAMELMLDDGQASRATIVADQLSNPTLLPGSYQFRYALIRAELSLQAQRAEEALLWLTGNLINYLDNPTQLGDPSPGADDYYFLLATAYRDNGEVTKAINTYLQISETGELAKNGERVNAIWTGLNLLDKAALTGYARNANSYESRGWIELATVAQSDQTSIKRQLDSIAQWRRVWIRHSAATRLPEPLIALQRVWDERPRHIALILPLQEIAGNAILEGFFSAYYQALAISREVPRISIYDSSGVKLVYPIYDEAVASGADLIIGPLNKDLVNQLQQLPELPVPTLALNYADNIRSQRDKLYQFGLAPEDEIAQAVDLAWGAGHRNAAVITPQSASYLRLQSIFSELWSAKGGNLVSKATFSGDSDYIDVIKRLMAIDSSEARKNRLLDLLPRSKMEFTPRRRNDLDFIFLIANPGQGRQIKPTLAFYFAGDVPVYSMPSIYDGQVNASENRDLDGIIFTDSPWVLGSSNPLKSEMASSLRQAQGTLQRLRAMGIDCFRLYPRLQQLADRQIDSLQGATGVLRLSSNQQIHRTLDVAIFVNGVAIEIEPSSANDGS